MSSWLCSAFDRAVRVDPETGLGNGRFPETNTQGSEVQLSLCSQLLPSGQSCMLWHCPAFVGRLNGCAQPMVPSQEREDLLSLSRAEAPCVSLGSLGSQELVIC